MLRAKLELVSGLSKLRQRVLLSPVITTMELRYGLLLNPQRTQKVEPAIASILSSVTILPFDVEEAERAAQIRAVLKSQGRPIGAYDVLIAATALQHDLLMVTANRREFERVTGLQVENWRQSAGAQN
ncbi:MAG: PIN domain-containing protein [Elainellaceae cyanobacterium]